jgi:uncharacterized membrane protein YeiH
MVKLDRRTIIPWVVTALAVGSLGGSLSDMVKQNSWFIIYAGLIYAWLFVLTGIATMYLNERK